MAILGSQRQTAERRPSMPTPFPMAVEVSSYGLLVQQFDPPIDLVIVYKYQKREMILKKKNPSIYA